MRRAFGMALLGAGFVALFTLPAQALEIGPVQVIVQPRVVLVPDAPPRPRVVVVEEPECRPVVERRVIVVRKHGHHWKEREYRREYFQGRDRDDCDDDDRYERVGHREVVVIRR